jgi:hypothetical protein
MIGVSGTTAEQLEAVVFLLKFEYHREICRMRSKPMDGI